jgi:phosphopantothenoylcysteine decarboxylase / phosphopantothenate---cysteine ligase
MDPLKGLAQDGLADGPAGGVELAGRHVLLGITGGVAAYKSCTLARELQRQGATVQVVMTEAATRFVGTATFQALTGRRVLTDQWDPGIDNNMAHIELVREADLVLVAPATADFIAKLAHGFADDLLSALCLARDCPLAIAPAMNRQMWQHPATQRNLRQLIEDGVTSFGPESGEQACGETGQGRMLEPAQLVECVTAFFVPKVLAGRRVLVTAGPTYEPIDPVRGLTNLSSGKMGYALARACRHAGADVVLVSGPTALPAPDGVRRVDVRTAQQMLAAVEAEVRGCDAFVSVAAVADWRIANPSDRKIKKGAGRVPALEFEQNPDILATIAARPDAPFCVGFAAETEDLESHAQQKRRAKGVPLLVGNLGHATFGRDDNELVLVDESGLTRLARASKDSLAATLATEIARRLPGSP